MRPPVPSPVVADLPLARSDTPSDTPSDPGTGAVAGADAAASGQPVLAVDLDGTLIRSDVLFESFWRAFARHPLAPLQAVASLLRGGRPGLKRRLAGLGPVDVAQLPYNPGMLDLIARARASGQRTALVTAADQGLATAVARHLGLFDAVHGSRPGLNLKGTAKAAFLRATYGAGGYVYAGDSPADLKVWPGAAAAVTVTPRADLRARVEGLGIPVTHLPTAAPDLRALGGLPGLWQAPGAVLVLALVTGVALRMGAGAAPFVVVLLLAGFAVLQLAGLMTADLLRRADTGGESAAERAFGLPRATLVAMALAGGGTVMLAATGGGALICAVLVGLTFCLPAARSGPQWRVAVFTAGRLCLVALAAAFAAGAV